MFDNTANNNTHHTMMTDAGGNQSTGTQVAGLNRLMGAESFLPFMLICIDHVMLSFVYFVKIELKYYPELNHQLP